MADLGNLWFSLGLDDSKFEQQWQRALQKYQNTAKINVDFKISDQAINELKRFKDSGFTAKEAKTYAQMAKAVMDVGIAQERYNRELAKTKALNDESAARISRQDSEAIVRNNNRNAESLARQELIRARINNLDRQALGTNKKLTTHYRDQALWVQNLMTFASNYFSLYAVKNFVTELANVTGEFEKQRVTLQAMIGESEGLEIFGKMKDLAVRSPFEFKDLASYAKQLAAFSVPYEELYDTTKRLADVSAGLGVDMSRIILAYGQIRSAGVLKGTELRQLTEAGVPIVEKLAKKLSEATGEAIGMRDVFDEISKKSVSFEMVKDIFEDMTSIGGEFYKMQEVQSDTLAGKISNLKDAYSIMLNEIGKSTESALKGGVEVLYKLMNNWEALGNTVLSVGTAYTFYQSAHILAFASTGLKKIGLFIEAWGRLGASITKAARALSMMNVASKAGVYGALAGIVAGISIAFYAAYRNTKRFNDELAQIKQSELNQFNSEKDHLDNLVDSIKKSNEGSRERKELIQEMNSRYGSYITNILDEYTALTKVEEAQKNITKALRERAQEDLYNKANQSIIDTYNKDAGEAITGIMSKLQDAGVSGEQASNVAAKIRQVLEGNYKASIKDIKAAIKETFRDGEKIAELIETEFRKESNRTASSLDYAPVDVSYQEIEDLANAIAVLEKNKAAVKREALAMFSDDIIDFDFIEEKTKQITEAHEAYVAAIKAEGQEKLNNDKEEQARQKNIDERLRKEEVSYLNQLIALYPENAKAAEKYRKELERLFKADEKWVGDIKELAEKFGVKGFNVREEEGFLDYVKRIKEEYKTAKSQIKDLTVDPTGLKPNLEKEIGFMEAFADAYKITLDEKGEKKNTQLFQNYKDKFDKFTSDIRLKISELNTSLSSISFKDINADNISSKLYEISSEFEKGAVDIEKYKEKVLKAWKEVLQAKAKSEGRVFSGDVTFDMLPKEAQQVISVYNQLIAKKREYDEALLNKSVIDKYASLAQREREILKAASAEFKVGYGKEGFDIEQWEKNLKESLTRLYEELDPIIKKAFQSTKYESREGIMSSIQALQKEINKGQLSDEDAERYLDRIIELKKTYEELGKVDITTNVSDLIARSKELKLIREELEATSTPGAKQMLQNLYDTKSRDYKFSLAATGADMFAKGLSRAASAMSELAEATGNAELEETAQKLENLGNTLSSTVQGFISGGWIGAAIGGIMSIISNSVNGIIKARIYNEQLTQSVVDYTNAIQNLKLQVNEADYDTIFGLNALEKINDAAKKAKEAMDLYLNELNKKMADPGPYGHSTRHRWSSRKAYEEELESYKRGLTELEAIQVKTRDRSGFAEFWGLRDEYKRLKDFAPDLWGEDGVFNTAKAEEFLNTSGNLLDKAQKKMIQNAIDLYKRYEENMEVINDYLKDIFSDTASTITDRMLESFALTGDAATELGDLIHNIAKNMAKDLIQSLLVDQYLQPAIDRVKNLYDPNSKEYEDNAELRIQKSILAMQDGLMAAEGGAAEVNRILQGLANMGIDFSGETENASQVMSGLTEDQQNLLLSYINGIRADVSINKGLLTSIVSSVGTINNNLATAIVIWTQIEANTHRSADGVDRIIGFFESVIGPYDGGSGQAFQVNIA